MHGKTKIAADGTCRMAGGTSSVQLKRLIVDHLEFEQELLTALPRSLGTVWSPLNPAGQNYMDGNLALPCRAKKCASPQLDWNLLFLFGRKLASWLENGTYGRRSPFYRT